MMDYRIADSPHSESVEVSPLLAGHLLRSSVTRGWRGIIVEEYEKEPASVEMPPLDGHSLCLFLGKPLTLTRQINGKTEQEKVRRGQLSLTPAHNAATWSWDNTSNTLHISIEPDFVHQVAAETLDIDPREVELLPRFNINDPLLEHIGLSLLSELRAPEFGSELYAASLANQLAIHLLRNYSTVSRLTAKSEEMSSGLPAARLRRATEYIHAHIDREVTLAELAAVLEMSPFHFARLFKQSVGQTPHQYVLAQRIEQARRQLVESDKPIIEIAYQLGFADQSHFTAMFRKLTGTTPRAYRETV